MTQPLHTCTLLRPSLLRESEIGMVHASVFRVATHECRGTTTHPHAQILTQSNVAMQHPSYNFAILFVTEVIVNICCTFVRAGALALLLAAGAGGATLAGAADGSGKTTATTERAKAKAAQELLDDAADYLRKHGPEKSFAVFNDRQGGFVRGELYVFALDTDGHMYAHGGEPAGLVGLNVRDLRDAAGKPLIQEMLEGAAAKGEGTVEYKWLNRTDNRVENKTTYYRKVDKYVLGVGYYTARSSADQAKDLLAKAVAQTQKNSAAAFASFNHPFGGFVKDDLYVFVIGIDDGKFYAHGATPTLTGMGAKDLRDAAGAPLVQNMIKLVQEKGAGQIDYVWRNPVTNKVEDKHSFVQKVGKYLIGVGYYTK